ncbi:MAG TPA: FapA family protein, partial [Planctomycetota bacterium]|nr:FapA family protein [Planctomycetota bacterium]
TVQAGYISGAGVRCDGDVIVLKEILQSDVRSHGAVRVEAGRIVGGQVVALGGIVVAEAGSSAGIPTLFAPGEDYALAEFIAARERESSELRTKCDALRVKLKPLADLRGRLTAGQKRTVSELASEIRAAETRQAQIRQEIDERVTRVQASACREVRVLKELHPHVTFRIGKESLTTETPRRGPVVVRLDESGGIAVLSETG